jgi:hypothetical protein
MVHLTGSKWSEGFVHEPVHAGLGYAEGLYVSLPGIEGLSHSESRNYSVPGLAIQHDSDRGCPRSPHAHLQSQYLFQASP